MLTVCVLGVWGVGVYCCSAMSVFIPCFLKLFEVMGAFLREIKSIMERSERQRQSHRRPLQPEKISAAGDGGMSRSAATPFSMYQHILLLGLQLNTRRSQAKPSGLIRLVFCNSLGSNRVAV